MIRPLALALAALLPLAALAQGAPAATPAPAPDPAPVAAAVPAPAPVAAPVAAPAPAPAPAAPAAAGGQPLTVDLGGWLQWNTFADFGGLNANDLARYAAPLRSERGLGMSIRQSRVRANLGLPGGGLLGDATLKGLVELDFMGGYAGGDESLPIVRLRHAWLQATWKELGNLQLLVGQSWGIFEGPHFATSLAHLAVPRFAGAGFLYRRAPQVRLSGVVGGDLAAAWQVGLLAPMDKKTSAVPAAAAQTSVGERSGLPDLEARAALLVRRGGKPHVELGASVHLSRERYLLDGVAGAPNLDVDSFGVALDARVDLPMVTLVGGAYSGKNLDILSTVGDGVRITTGTTPAGATGVATIRSKGAWGQLQVTPVAPLQLLLGGGVEAPVRGDLAANAVWRNGQLSGGAVVSLTPRWRASVEYTRYVTRLNAATNNRYVAGQLEVATLYAF